MTAFGLTLSGEEHGPVRLIDLAVEAERAGFDFVSLSDHYHPWVAEQGHSPFVWAVLGAIARTTDRIAVGTGVTCPTTRIHPAIVAQAAATTSLLLPHRFFLGVGTGEALNEHIIGIRWPQPAVRRAMLEEAVDVIRLLFEGKTVDHNGTYYEVENARLFDAPEAPVPIIVSGFGEKSAALAGRIGDGYWGNAPDRGLLETFARNGGTGPRYAQLDVCWAEDAAAARATVHRVWPNAGVPGQLSQDLPTWTHFEEASSVLTEEQTTESVPCGPDIVDDLLSAVDQYIDAGYDHLYFHQIGDDQAGFVDYWSSTLRPALEHEHRLAS